MHKSLSVLSQLAMPLRMTAIPFSLSLSYIFEVVSIF